jgi:hypothetical protein
MPRSHVRWNVKTLEDKFEPTGRPTVWTVHNLVHVHSFRYPKRKETRTEPEKQEIEITAILFKFGREKNDGDMHIVLKDPVHHETMNAEIPDSIYAPRLGALYNALCDSLQRHCGTAPKDFSLRKPEQKGKVYVTVRGLLYLDWDHGERAKYQAKNFVECHPVLFLQFQQQEYFKQ